MFLLSARPQGQNPIHFKIKVVMMSFQFHSEKRDNHFQLKTAYMTSFEIIIFK